MKIRENLNTSGHIVDLVTEELSGDSLNIFLFFLFIFILSFIIFPLAQRSALNMIIRPLEFETNNYNAYTRTVNSLTGRLLPLGARIELASTEIDRN